MACSGKKTAVRMECRCLTRSPRSAGSPGQCWTVNVSENNPSYRGTFEWDRGFDHAAFRSGSKRAPEPRTKPLRIRSVGLGINVSGIAMYGGESSIFWGHSLKFGGRDDNVIGVTGGLGGGLNVGAGGFFVLGFDDAGTTFRGWSATVAVATPVLSMNLMFNEAGDLSAVSFGEGSGITRFGQASINSEHTAILTNGDVWDALGW